MLEPQSRRLLLESFQPPDGHRLDWAIGTSYSLDLVALLAAPVAFAFSDWQDREGRPVLEPLALLKATRQYADRMLLFCQAGRIYIPRNYQPLLANLEGSIAEAFAPRGGSFHPKVWFLRYLGEENTVTYRFLCLSRNMTFDRSWDTMLSLEGPLSDRTNAIARNHPLGQFVDALPAMIRRDLTPVWQGRIKQLADEVRRVKFDIPEPFEEISFWPIGIGDSRVWPFPDRFEQALLVSPFVDAGFVESIAKSEAPMQLISRDESLARMSAAELAAFEKLWILDETAEPEAVEMEDALESQGAESTEPVATLQNSHAEIPLLGLHAKIYIADIGWNAHIWTGSANATKAAFTKNVEFLVELQGKKSRNGVAAVLGHPDNDTPHAACLADLLKTFVPGEAASESTAEQDAFERLAETLAQQLAAQAPAARCDPLSEIDDYILTIGPTERASVLMPPGYSLRVWPISLLPDQALEVVLIGDIWCRFERVSLLGLTSFFAFELKSVDKRFSSQFVLNVPLVNAPENRRERILRQLLSDRGRVLQFLLMLLMDPSARDFGYLLGTMHDNEGKSAALPGVFESTLFESLMRALDRNPDQIDQVEQIIRDLEQSDEGRQLLPENLHAVWEPILQVHRQQQRKIITES